MEQHDMVSYSMAWHDIVQHAYIQHKRARFGEGRGRGGKMKGEV